MKEASLSLSERGEWEALPTCLSQLKTVSKERLEILPILSDKLCGATDGRRGDDAISQGSRTTSRGIKEARSFIGNFSIHWNHIREDLRYKNAVIISERTASKLRPSHRADLNGNALSYQGKNTL